MVKSLLHFDGVQGGTVITDQIPGHAWALTAPAIIDTAHVKFGTGSLFSSNAAGGAGGIKATHADFIPGVQDFCVEGWNYMSNAAGQPNSCLWQLANSGTTKFISAYSNINYSTYLFANSDTLAVTPATGPFPLLQYSHWAIVRKAGVLYIIINGSILNAGAVGTDFNDTSIMAIANGVGGGQGQAGSADEFRYTIGTSRGYEVSTFVPIDFFPNS
jgi:hypothetical protein